MREAHARTDAETARLSVEGRRCWMEVRWPSNPFLASLRERGEGPVDWRNRARGAMGDV